MKTAERSALVLLTGQACLLGLWFAFSDRGLWPRAIGFAVGLLAMVLASVSVEPSGFAIRDRLGLVIEFLGIPTTGVAVVLLTLRSCAFHLDIADEDAQDSLPRISLSGLLAIVTAVAALLVMRSAIQFLAGFDRISVSIVTQTVALSSLSLAAMWATLSGRRTKVRVVAYVFFALAVSFFVGYYWGASFQFVFGLVPALTVFLAAIIILITLAFSRRSGIRIVVREPRSVRLVLRVATCTLMIAGALFGIDLLYAKYWIGNSTQVSESQPLISDTSGGLRLKAIERFQASPSVEGLVQLLRLNGDATVIDTLRGMTGGGGTYNTIGSGGRRYIVAIGRKSSGSPPGLRQQLAKAYSNDWMLAYSVAFFFDAQGILVEKVGGGVATDGINGDDVWLTPLGTTDQWFAMVTRFEKQPPYDYQTEVRIIEPGLPTAFAVHHFPNSTAFTGDPSEDSPYFMFFGLPNGAKMPNNASGKGRDGRDYPPKIVWDSAKRVFVGPSQLSYKGQPSFQIDLDSSMRFMATDDGTTDVE